jgi:hypothetical protein
MTRFAKANQVAQAIGFFCRSKIVKRLNVVNIKQASKRLLSNAAMLAFVTIALSGFGCDRTPSPSAASASAVVDGG